MMAQRYLAVFKPTCEFINSTETAAPEAGPLARTWEEHPCGRPAVAVYVTDDDHQRGTFVCPKHAHEAELNGDGPVFYVRAMEDRPLRNGGIDLGEWADESL